MAVGAGKGIDGGVALMHRRKGFVYILFAMMMLNLMLVTVILPLQVSAPETGTEKINVDELFYFLQSIQDDINRAIDIAGRRSFVAITNRVLDTGSGVSDATNKTVEAFYNATIDGNVSTFMEDSSFGDWLVKMADQAESEGYEINITSNMSHISLSSESAFQTRFVIEYNLSLSDPRIDTRFDRELTTEREVRITGIDDPLLYVRTSGKRSNSYNRCSVSKRAEKTDTGSSFEYNYTYGDNSTRNWTSADATVFNGSSVGGIDDRFEKLLVTEDLCDYDPDELERFRGVLSEVETDGTDVCGGGEEIHAYLGGIGNFSSYGNGTRLVMTQDEVWRNHIPDQIDARCYFPDQQAPGFFARLENNLTGSGAGLASFLDVPDLPPAVQEANSSAVDYVYFNDSSDYGGTVKIKGVTDHREWFRLDADHVDSWGIGRLEYRKVE
jgi:hypothetical protein